MIVIADITVPADAFELGEIFGKHPELSIDADKLVPIRKADLSLFWITDSGSIDPEALLRESEHTRSVSKLSNLGDRALYHVVWDPEIDGIIDAIVAIDADILEAQSPSNVGNWQFKLRFRNRDDVSEFTRLSTEQGVPITLSRLYNPDNRVDAESLSTEQRETIISAYENGYFDIPRRISLAELGDEFGVSDNAISQRLRRGLSALIYEEMIVDSDN